MKSSDLTPRVFLLDVRSTEEFAKRHVPAARHIPLAELPGRIVELPRDVPIVTICAHGGGRSQGAASILRDAGLDATALEGGTDGYFDVFPTGR